MNELQQSINEAAEGTPDFRKAAVKWFTHCCNNLEEPLLSKGIELGRSLLNYQNCCEKCIGAKCD